MKPTKAANTGSVKTNVMNKGERRNNSTKHINSNSINNTDANAFKRKHTSGTKKGTATIASLIEQEFDSDDADSNTEMVYIYIYMYIYIYILYFYYNHSIYTVPLFYSHCRF